MGVKNSVVEYINSFNDINKLNSLFDLVIAIENNEEYGIYRKVNAMKLVFGEDVEKYTAPRKVGYGYHAKITKALLFKTVKRLIRSRILELREKQNKNKKENGLKEKIINIKNNFLKSGNG